MARQTSCFQWITVLYLHLRWSSIICFRTVLVYLGSLLSRIYYLGSTIQDHCLRTSWITLRPLLPIEHLAVLISWCSVGRDLQMPHALYGGKFEFNSVTSLQCTMYNVQCISTVHTGQCTSYDVTVLCICIDAVHSCVLLSTCIYSFLVFRFSLTLHCVLWIRLLLFQLS